MTGVSSMMQHYCSSAVDRKDRASHASPRRDMPVIKSTDLDGALRSPDGAGCGLSFLDKRMVWYFLMLGRSSIARVCLSSTSRKAAITPRIQFTSLL